MICLREMFLVCPRLAGKKFDNDDSAQLVLRRVMTSSIASDDLSLDIACFASHHATSVDESCLTRINCSCCTVNNRAVSFTCKHVHNLSY